MAHTLLEKGEMGRHIQLGEREEVGKTRTLGEKGG